MTTALDLTGIISQLLGGEENTSVDKTGTTKTGGTTTTTGTTKTGGTTTTTGGSTTSGSTTQKTDADVSALREVYAKQAAGVTPQMLEAIFAEGSKKIPTLTSAYANAVGARSGGNSPLGVTLRDLNAELTYDAAKLNNQLLADSGKTAASIADLTKSIFGTNDSTTTNNSTAVTDNTTTTDSTAVTDNISNTNENTNVKTDRTVDPKSLGTLLGGAAGISGLDWLLGGNGATGGVNDIFKMITGVGKTGQEFANAPAWLKSLFGGGAGAIAGAGGQAFNMDQILADMDNWDFTGDGTGGTGFDWANFQMPDNMFGGTTGGFDFGDLFGGGADTGGFNFSDLATDFNWADLGFADGGLVKSYAEGGAVTPGADPRRKLMQMLILKKLASTPEGAQKLKAMMQSRKGASGTSGIAEAQGSNYANPDARMSVFDDAKEKFLQANFGKYRGQATESTDPFAEAAGNATPESRAQVQETSALMNGVNQAWLSTLSPRQRAEYEQMKAAQFSKRNSTAKGGMGLVLAAMGGIPAIQAVAGAAGAGGGLSGIFNAYQGASGLASKIPGLVFKGANAADMLSSIGKSRSNGLGAFTEIAQPAQRTALPAAIAPQQSTSDSYADGGDVDEGIEDDVLARVSEGEYIIPADVVRKKGTDFFDKLIEKDHTPAAMQKAMGI